MKCFHNNLWRYLKQGKSLPHVLTALLFTATTERAAVKNTFPNGVFMHMNLCVWQVLDLIK